MRKKAGRCGTAGEAVGRAALWAIQGIRGAYGAEAAKMRKLGPPEILDKTNAKVKIGARRRLRNL